jgi:hypothetical protein
MRFCLDRFHCIWIWTEADFLPVLISFFMCVLKILKCLWYGTLVGRLDSVSKVVDDISYFVLIEHMYQGSPNQVKWATFSPWFQWNRPISVKKRNFSRPVNLFKSVFFSPIIILFLQYSFKRSSHVPEILPIQGLMFNILFQTR